MSWATRRVTGFEGVRVVAQMESGPDSDAGLKLNDVITSFNGESTESLPDFFRVVRNLSGSGAIPLEILHRGESRGLSLGLP